MFNPECSCHAKMFQGVVKNANAIYEVHFNGRSVDVLEALIETLTQNLADQKQMIAEGKIDSEW